MFERSGCSTVARSVPSYSACVDPRRMQREALADAAVVDGDARCPGRRGSSPSSATWTFRRIVSSTRWPGIDVSRARRVGERVAQILRDVLQRPHVEVRGRVLHRRLLEIGGDGSVTARRLSGRSPPRAPAEDAALEQGVAHHAVPPVRAARDLAAGEEAFERRLAVLVDDEPAVLVVEDGVREDRLARAGRCPPAR